MTRFLLVASLMMNLVACGTSPKTNLYVLNTEYIEPVNSPSGLGIGVWKVSLPPLLNRPEIVTREGNNKVSYADFHQWAGGLDDNVTRFIAFELSQQLKTDRVSVSPWHSHKKNKYQVKVFIYRFDGELGGDAVIGGIWSLLDGEGRKELRREIFYYTAKTKGKEHEDIVVALSQLTKQLSGVIASAIEEDKK